MKQCLNEVVFHYLLLLFNPIRNPFLECILKKASGEYKAMPPVPTLIVRPAKGESLGEFHDQADYNNK
jgi:hypothetical protein